MHTPVRDTARQLQPEANRLAPPRSVHPYPLQFRPVFKDRIWGGSRLRTWFPECPSGSPIGEAWVVSDHPEGETPVANGAYAGLTLHELMQREPSWFGNCAAISGQGSARFPLLVKWLDATADLSVQVHPDDEYGFRHAGEQGKTECWWVLDARPGARIVYGHNAQSRSEFETKVRERRWDQLLCRVEVRSGDFFFVPAGKLHALGAGIQVVEIQQSSDTTYRVYDYDRLDASGKPRPLHLEQALEVIPYPDRPVQSQRYPLNRPGLTGEHLVSCPYFTVEHWVVQGDYQWRPERVTILSVVGGEGRLSPGLGDSGSASNDDSVRAEAWQAIPVTTGSQVLLPLGVGARRLEGHLEVIAAMLP
ncbi:MAG: class I mannose-6-phosphate isomerase [Alicyclobacillaceae bacterium]|nr:class I mannose-6-phosphate isomerase [Alicyclobacillaceae bacterium]